MKRAISAVAGVLLLGLTLVVAPSAAQELEEGVTPISIYSLDDGSIDDSVEDAANTTPTGRTEGDPEPTADRFGNPTGALACDGVDDVIHTEEPSNINPLTFSAWFRADDVSDEHSIVDSDESGRYGHSLIIGYDDPNDPNDTPRDGSLSIQYHDGVWDTDVVINEGEWTNVFVTYSGDKIRVYIGTENRPTELVAERDHTPPDDLDGSTFRFCRHNEDDPQRFVGAIDDIRFYDVAIDPTDPDFPVDPPVEGEPPRPETDAPGPEVPAEDEVVCGRRCRAKSPSNGWGDVHIRTPDALVYDFQFTGDFVLAQSDDGVVELQSRMVEWDNPALTSLVSVNAAVAMSVAGEVLVVTAGADTVGFTVDGVDTPLPAEDTTLPSGTTLEVNLPGTGFRTDVTVVWPDGETAVRLQVSARPFIDVGIIRVAGDRAYSGIFGNLDGVPENDMQLRDGDVVAQPVSGIEELAAFGDSWRVAEGDSLFAEPLAADAAQTPDELVELDDLDEEARAQAEQICRDQGITDPLALHNCTYDIAATGDDGFAESAAVQEEAVEQLPEGAPIAVVAVEGAAPEGMPIAGIDDPNADDSDGVNPILFVGLGVLVLAVIGIAVVFVRKGSSGSGPAAPYGAGPGYQAGPGHQPGPR